MSIDTIHSSTTAAADVAQKKTGARPPAQAPAAQKPEDIAFKVNISPGAGQQLQTTAHDDEIRRDKVAAIRDQLAAGNYNISGKDVATKILNALKG